jgi:Flp pilus assembly protein TadB
VKEGTVPLSEHEQRLLDEIEQALYAEDPKFAASVRSARRPMRGRRLLILSVLGVVVGLSLVLVGLITTIVPLSVVGFVLVVGSCGFAATRLRSRDRSNPEGSDSSNVRDIRQGGLRSRMEDRLRRRFDEN